MSIRLNLASDNQEPRPCAWRARETGAGAARHAGTCIKRHTGVRAMLSLSGARAHRQLPIHRRPSHLRAAYLPRAQSHCRRKEFSATTQRAASTSTLLFPRAVALARVAKREAACGASVPSIRPSRHRAAGEKLHPRFDPSACICAFAYPLLCAPCALPDSDPHCAEGTVLMQRRRD